MIVPVEITFQGLPASDALRQNIEKHVARLERFADDIISCHVLVDAAEERRHKGNRYRVHVHLTLPGGTIDAGKTPKENRTHEDPYVAVRDTFNAARRLLEDFVRKRRRDVKTHEAPDAGRISELDVAGGWGVIAADDGREISFHRNSLVDADFDRLSPGDRVRFATVQDVDGIRASSVHPAGRAAHVAAVAPNTSRH